MATFIGYSTIDKYKNYTITDFELIKQDLLNALNIRQGEIPGRPEVGTTIWGLIFEPQSPQTSQELTREIQRVVAQDPRISISNIDIFPQENGILVELEVETIAGQDAEFLNLFFNNQTLRAAFSDI